MKKAFKKILASILVAVMVLTAAPLSGIKEITFEIKSKAEELDKIVSSIEIASLPQKTVYYYNIDGYEVLYSIYNEDIDDWEEVRYFDYDFNRSGLRIKVNYSDGTSEFSEEYDPFYFDDEEIIIDDRNNWNLGENTVTVSYMGKKANFNVSVVENPVESIELIKTPEKTTFFENADGCFSTYGEWDEYGRYNERQYFVYYYNDTFGMELKYNLKDGTSVTGDANYFTYPSNVYGQEYGEVWGIGTHTITLCIMECEVSYDIEVVKSPIIDIGIKSLPYKTVYYEGIDCTKQTAVDGYYDEYGNYAENEYEYYDCWIDTDGLEIELYFSDGSKEVVDADYVYYIQNSDYYFSILNYNYWYDSRRPMLGVNEIEVTFMGLSTSFNITIEESPYSGIEFTELNLKESYMNCEYPDITGSVIRLDYKNGNSEYFTVGEGEYDFGGWSYSNGMINGSEWYLSFEENNAAFNYLGFSVDIPINRNEKYMTYYEFIDEPESYTCEGSKIRMDFSDGTSSVAEVLDTDVRIGDGDDSIYRAGILRTDIGIFEFWFEILNYKNIDESVYRFGLGGINPEEFEVFYESSTNKSPVLCYITEMLVYYFNGYSRGFDFSPEDGVFYNGELTSDNIDSVLFVSELFIDNWQYNSFSSEKAEELILSLFNNQKIDLSISEFYDEASDVYTIPECGGFGDAGSRNRFTVNKTDGGYEIVYTRESFETVEEYSVAFDSENKCTYLALVDETEVNLEIASYPIKTDYLSGEAFDPTGLTLIYTDKYGNTNTVTDGFSFSPEVVSFNTEKVKITYNRKTVYVPINVKTILGDVNVDYFIDCIDALLVLQYCTNMIKLSEKQIVCADTSFDGRINSSDALMILQHSIGQINLSDR